MNPVKENGLLPLVLSLIVVAGIGCAGMAGMVSWSVSDIVTGSNPALHARQSRAIEIDARFRQGVMMLHARQYEHAVTALHRVLELAPDMPEAHVNMGFALIGLGRFKIARSFFESAIDLRPGQVNAYYGLAVALQGMNDMHGAMGAMKSYVHLHKGPEDAYMRNARAAMLVWQDALDLAERNLAEQIRAEQEKAEAARQPEGGKKGKK